jgi:uncharacterized protein YjbI with pentapeptide repeats
VITPGGEMNTISASEFGQKISEHQRWLAAGALNDGPSAALKMVVWDAALSGLECVKEYLPGIRLFRCYVSNCNFVECDFSQALFIESRFRECRFVNCAFRGSEMTAADCESVDFAGSDFTKADFTEAILSKADFTSCNLAWAWFTRADLRFAILDRVSMKGAKLIETKLYNTRQFEIESLDQILVQNVLVDPGGQGPPLSGIGALEFLLKP